MPDNDRHGNEQSRQMGGQPKEEAAKENPKKQRMGKPQRTHPHTHTRTTSSQQTHVRQQQFKRHKVCHKKAKVYTKIDRNSRWEGEGAGCGRVTSLASNISHG